MKQRFSTMSPRKVILITGSILLYLLILVVLLAVKVKEDAKEQRTVYGSLDNRFLSEITLEHEGANWYYRENEITNYLLIGSDQDSVNQMSGHQNGGQADFLIVLSVDRINRTITPVMLDRDTMTEVQTYGVFGHPSGKQVMQLCLAQAYSGKDTTGSKNTAQAVENLLYGVKIDRHVTLDISAIPMLNDAIGGVEVTLDDDFTVYDPVMTKGSTIRLTGLQAEFFVRGRMTVADGTNASRMHRQQQYISAFLAQLRQKMKTDPDMLMKLWESTEGQLVVVVLGILQGDLEYIWYPYRAAVPETGVLRWEIPVEEWGVLVQQPISLHALTVRVGPGGEYLWGEDVYPDADDVFSKTSRDVYRVHRWYAESGEVIEDDFRLFMVDLTEPMQQEILRIGEHVEEEYPILDYFPEKRKEEALLMLPEGVDETDLMAYDVIALMDEAYKDTYGDINAEFHFGSTYDAEKSMVVLAGFVNKDALEQPFMDWYVLRAESLEITQDETATDFIRIGLKQLNLPLMEEEPMMLVVISQTLEPKE